MQAPEQLAQLAESTGELRRAAEQGDLQRVEEILSLRQQQMEALRAPLDAALLEAAIQEGAAAGHALTAHREICRAQFGELEAERRHLSALAPRPEREPARLDLSA